MPQRLLGIDVGSYSIKVAEIERSFRRFELVGFYEQPIGSAAAAAEGSGPEVLALQRLFDEHTLSHEFLFAVLPGQRTALRMIEFPFGNFKKIDTTIEFELENYLPLPVEEMAIDYQILSAEKNRSKLLVAYARKGELIKFLNSFATAEVDPRFVGCEPVELSHLHKLGVVLPDGPFALMDIGHEKTDLCLFVGRELHSARTIMVGGRDLTHSVAEALKIPLPEAEKIKVEMGQVGTEAEGADTMTRQVAQALRAPLDDLLVQIRQTLLAFQQERGEVIQAILITGGTSRLSGIDQYLSRGLRKNVTFLDCLDIPANRLADTNWCRPIAATALTTAYRGVLGVGNRDIQFRRGEFAFRGEIQDLRGLVRGIGIQVAVISFFVLATFLVSYFNLKGKIREQGERLATVAAEVLPELPKKSLSNPKNVLSILAGRINEMGEKKKKLEEETAFTVLKALKEISGALPARETVQLDVDDLTVTSGRVRLSGRTNSFEAVDQIKTALASSERFQNVATENVRKGVGDQIKFEISFQLPVGVEKGRGS